MPDDVQSTEVVRGSFVGARGLTISDTNDYEDGGIAFSDPSQGLNYQIWRCRIPPSKNQILISAPNTLEFAEYTGTDITSCSLSFDQNMRPVIAFVEGGQAKLRWYDSVAAAQVVTNLPAGAITPRVFLDDKRPGQSSASDVLLFYCVDGTIYHCKQRERYETARVWATGYPGGILKVGMNNKLRVQVLLRPAVGL